MNLLRENTIGSLKNNKIEDHFGIKIQEIYFVNKINLRINPENIKYMKACGKILNTILPAKPNTFVKNDNLKIIWLSPDEWLIINGEDKLFAKLKNGKLVNSWSSMTKPDSKKILKNIDLLL